MMRSAIAKGGRTQIVVLAGLALLWAGWAGEARATSMWNDFSDRSDTQSLASTDISGTPLTSSAIVTATTTAPTETSSTLVSSYSYDSVTSTLQNTGARTNYRYRSAYSETSVSSAGSALTNTVSGNRYRRRLSTTTLATSVAAVGVPDSGNTLLLMFGSLAVLAVVRVTLLKKYGAP